MNAFLIAATAMLLLLLLPGVVVATARPIDALAALQLCGTTITLVLLCLAEGFHRSVYFNVPLVSALCVWVGGLVYGRFVGRLR